jgi:hypothetical protein
MEQVATTVRALEKRHEFCESKGMSFAEMMELLPTLSDKERAELADCLGAIEEGVSVEEYRAIKAAIEESLNDPSPGYTSEEVRAHIERIGQGDAAAA